MQALDFRSESRASVQSSTSALLNTTAQICPSARAKISALTTKLKLARVFLPEELQRELSLARAREADDGAALHKVQIELQTLKTKRDNEMEELRLTVKVSKRMCKKLTCTNIFLLWQNQNKTQQIFCFGMIF